MQYLAMNLKQTLTEAFRRGQEDYQQGIDYGQNPFRIDQEGSLIVNRQSSIVEMRKFRKENKN